MIWIHGDYLSTGEEGGAWTRTEVTFVLDTPLLISHMGNLLVFFEGSYMLSSPAGLMRYEYLRVKPLCLRIASVI